MSTQEQDIDRLIRDGQASNCVGIPHESSQPIMYTLLHCLLILLFCALMLVALAPL